MLMYFNIVKIVIYVFWYIQIINSLIFNNKYHLLVYFPYIWIVLLF